MSHKNHKTSPRQPLPDLSRFEWQCLKHLWERGEASAREIHGDLSNAPGYSTVRTILQRLEEKGAIQRTHRQDKAWIYRPAVSRPRMIRREVKRFLDAIFDGAAIPLVSHLADMDALGLEDLRALEQALEKESTAAGQPGRVPRRRKTGKTSGKKSTGGARRRSSS